MVFGPSLSVALSATRGVLLVFCRERSFYPFPALAREHEHDPTIPLLDRKAEHSILDSRQPDSQIPARLPSISMIGLLLIMPVHLGTIVSETLSDGQHLQQHEIHRCESE